jgi:hypothetical protein
MLTFFWQYRNTTGIRTFDNLDSASLWALNMLNHCPTITIERV